MKLKALYALLLCLPALGQAAERNDIPDCYGYAKVNEHRQPGSGRELTVIVDQTIPMPESIQKAAWGQINRFVAPGDKIRLYEAYSDGEEAQFIVDEVKALENAYRPHPVLGHT